MTLFKILLMLSLLGAQDVLVEPRDITVKHIVQPGDTLHKITRNYLGTDILWQENWKLNPHIQNPDSLKIGDELTIIKERIIPAEKAKVLNVVNRVEKKPSDGKWSSAQEGDELIQQEGVRTYAKSSALLEFNDESQLKVLEFSQIFLQARHTGITGTDSATIEVVKGDAELKWQPLKNKQTEISIVIGETISKPNATLGQVSELRTGLTESGNSVISVYQGNSAVASAGTEVDVEEGMGLAVKPGQAPPQPQPLLPAPKISENVVDSYHYSNPVLSWSAVKNAEKYLLEICADNQCQSILKQQTSKRSHSQIKDFKQKGQFHYRIAAINSDEIVGFRTLPHSITFTSEKEDNQAPVVAIAFVGASNFENGQYVVGPDTQIKIHAHDELSQLASLHYKWSEQNDWLVYTGEMLEIPKQGNRLQILAVDYLNQKVEVQYQFVTAL